MTAGEHSRHQIWNPGQHPYRHPAEEIAYSNRSMGTLVTNMGQALDYLFTVIYPQSQAAVDTVADLPAVGNTIGDLRIVNDDGDGRGASYRWWAKEGDVAAAWHKWADIDWGADSILQSWEQRTQYQWVMRHGYDDVDDAGVGVLGVLAGQSIYGGRSAGSNLTLFANSGDGVGAATGYVQFGDNVRPTADGTFSLGTTAYRFAQIYTGTLYAGTLTAASGSITDSSGTISFGDEHLTTTGNITGGTLNTGTLSLTGGQIHDSSGAIDFGAANLATTGTLGAGVATFTSVSAMGAASAFATATTIANLTFENNQITAVDDWIDFLDTVIYLEGALNSTAEITTSSFGIFGNLKISGDTVSQNGFSGNLYLTAGGGGSDKVVLGSQAEVLGDFIVDGDTYVGTDFKISGMTLSWPTGAGANIATFWGRYLDLNVLSVYSHTDNATKLGDTANRFSTLYLGTGISDGTDAITMATLLSFRDALSGASSGMTLFYNGTKWVPSVPDTEIDHGTITGLLDDDHTQYVLLAGRSTGQTLYGAVTSGGNLILDSTFHATKGYVGFNSYLRPGGDNTLDLGASGASLKDIYVKGQLIAARLENQSSAPSASAGTKGRTYFNTTDSKVYVDIGGTWNKVGGDKVTYQDSTSWTGAVLTHTYTVDGTDGAITGKTADARLTIWSLKDNANTFNQVLCDITATATTVTITTGEYLPSGTYTLVGVG